MTGIDVCHNHLFCRLASNAHANNPTRDNTIPNPGAGLVPVTAVSAGLFCGVAAGGCPIAIRAALGSVAWSGWFPNNVPYELSGNVLFVELRIPYVPLERR